MKKNPLYWGKLEMSTDNAHKKQRGTNNIAHMQDSDNANNNNILACMLSAHYVTQD